MIQTEYTDTHICQKFKKKKIIFFFNFYFTYSTKMGGSLEASHCADGGNRRGEFEVSLQCFHSDNLHHHYHLHYHRHRQYYHKHIDVQYVSVVLVVKLIYLSYTKSS